MRVKNTSTSPVGLVSGSTLGPGDWGDTVDDDPSLEAGLLTAAPDPPKPRGKPDQEVSK